MTTIAQTATVVAALRARFEEHDWIGVGIALRRLEELVSQSPSKAQQRASENPSDLRRPAP